MPESDSPAFIPGTPAEMQPPAEPVPLSALSFPPAAGEFSVRSALPTAIITGLAIGIGSMIPLGLAWIILVIGTGGALSVVLYKRRHPTALNMRAVDGGKLGALASLFGYMVFALVVVLAFVTNGAAVKQELVSRIQEMKAPDPATQENLRMLAQKLATPEGLAVLVTFGLAILFFFFLTVGAAGGAIGATLMHRDRRH